MDEVNILENNKFDDKQFERLNITCKSLQDIYDLCHTLEDAKQRAREALAKIDDLQNNENDAI